MAKTNQNVLPQLRSDEDTGKKRQLSSRFLNVASYSHFATIFGDRVVCTHAPHPHIFFFALYFFQPSSYISGETQEGVSIGVCEMSNPIKR